MGPIGDAAGTKPRVLIVLPFDMSVRNFLSSPVAAHLAADASLDVTIVSRERRDREAVARLPGLPILWEPMLRPFQASLAQGVPLMRRIRLLASDVRVALGHYLFLVLAYRFNTINGFRGFSDRIRQSRPLRRLAFREGLPSRKWLGIPFPRSRVLFNALSRIYFSRWQCHLLVEELFDRLQPHAVVITHLQSSTVTPYVLAAGRRKIPVLGMNGSWDQPTTKGPMLPFVDEVLAQSKQVVDDLAVIHGFPRERTRVVGWPQMDIYSGANALTARAQFLEGLGLAPAARYILFAAYSERLGSHEPDVCRAIAAAIARGDLGAMTVLYIRCHPLDNDWKARLGALHAPPRVIVEPPQLGRLDHLKNLIGHADAVIASAGTMNLDAVALDTPSVALALEDEDVPYFDRPARRYDMEHVAVMMQTGGVRKVRSETELLDVLRAYLDDRELDSEGRTRLREQLLAPLDGQASRRIATAIGRFAEAAALRAPRVSS